MKKILLLTIITTMTMVATGFSNANLIENPINAKDINSETVLFEKTEMNNDFNYTKSNDNAKEIKFKKSEIREVYSLDYQNRSYHKIKDRKTIADIANRLNDYSPPVSKDKKQVGFLIITSDGKYSYFLDGDEKKASKKDSALIAIAKECNKKYLGSAQWLSYMSESNITQIEYNGFYCDNAEFKKRKGKATQSVVDVETADKTEISIISQFLKGITVDKNPKISKGITNPPTGEVGYLLSIKFKNGVSYTVFGTDYELIITSSDMNESIFYNCSQDQMYAMADMMFNLNSSVVQ